jgi:hypothetical protein
VGADLASGPQWPQAYGTEEAVKRRPVAVRDQKVPVPAGGASLFGAWGDPLDYSLTSLTVDGVELKRFADARIWETVAEGAKALGPDDHGAVIAFADVSGWRLAGVVRLGEHLTALGVLAHDWKTKEGQGARVEGAVVWRW